MTIFAIRTTIARALAAAGLASALAAPAAAHHQLGEASTAPLALVSSIGDPALGVAALCLLVAVGLAAIRAARLGA